MQKYHQVNIIAKGYFQEKTTHLKMQHFLKAPEKSLYWESVKNWMLLPAQ